MRKPPTSCGISELQLVHYINPYGYRLKQPARWNDIEKIWENDRGEAVKNVIDFEPMVEGWNGN